MATEAKTQVYYINIGGGLANVGAVRWAWRGRKNLYKNIASGLGVVLAKDTDKGLVYGTNSPRPAEVRINYTDSTGKAASTIRFCEPDKLNSVTHGGALNGKKVWVAGKEYNINKVTMKSN
ncbi:hypothetical protein [Anabaena azotica]|uniref:SxtE n=1 Tax=Anabaena azotica FACHB-119 TaxID=947527 RepID=A0ABR8D8C3_9NOST|nr:hypothetical protein [Anabaena azotica]MBD2503415.1 hypothetical protein [Anabaena azotica FACHB-119]